MSPQSKLMHYKSAWFD